MFLALLVLLGLTLLAARFDLGPFNLAIALVVAAAKTLLIALYFMHLRYHNWLAWAVAGAGVVWLVILIGLTLSDYVSHGWLGIG